jgi:hypothetical protein
VQRLPVCKQTPAQFNSHGVVHNRQTSQCNIYNEIVEEVGFTEEYDKIVARFEKASDIKAAIDFALGIDPYRSPQIWGESVGLRVLTTDDFSGFGEDIPTLGIVYEVDEANKQACLKAIRLSKKNRLSIFFSAQASNLALFISIRQTERLPLSDATCFSSVRVVPSQVAYVSEKRVFVVRLLHETTNVQEMLFK